MTIRWLQTSSFRCRCFTRFSEVDRAQIRMHLLENNDEPRMCFLEAHHILKIMGTSASAKLWNNRLGLVSLISSHDNQLFIMEGVLIHPKIWGCARISYRTHMKHLDSPKISLPSNVLRGLVQLSSHVFRYRNLFSGTGSRNMVIDRKRQNCTVCVVRTHHVWVLDNIWPRGTLLLISVRA